MKMAFLLKITEDEDGDMDAGDSMVQEAEPDLNSKTVKAKLLQFCENRRPAYWGTWSKKSKNICARRPFARDVRFPFVFPLFDLYSFLNCFSFSSFSCQEARQLISLVLLGLVMNIFHY